jgi:hypothetical protein
MMNAIVSTKEKMVLDGNIDIYSNPMILHDWMERINKYLYEEPSFERAYEMNSL